MKTSKPKFDKDFKNVVSFLQQNRHLIYTAINDSSFVGADNWWVKIVDCSKKIEMMIRKEMGKKIVW